MRGGNGARLAFADPWRRLTYGKLHERSAAFAGALCDAGVAREQRIALLLLDTVDFPIAFWGAIRAGIVPVPINTLLPPDLVAYILGDSRAVALVVSAPLWPALRPLLPALPHLRQVIVAAPDGGAAATAAGETGLPQFISSARPQPQPAACSRDEVAFWLYSSGSTGAPKGARHVHSSLRATAETYGAQVLQIRPDDVVFSAAKLFFAYGLGNAMTFPMAVGAGRGARRHAALAGDDLRRRAHPLRRAACPPGDRGRRRLGSAAPLHFGGRGIARAYRRALARGGRRRHPRRHRLDRNAAHLSVEPPRRHPLQHDRQAGAGLRGPHRRRRRPGRAGRRAGRAGRAGGERRRRLLEPARQVAS